MNQIKTGRYAVSWKVLREGGGVTGLPGLAVSTATDCALAVATAVFEPGWPS
jgi:hypothetical protein